jgi:hypothetical protein
LKACGSEGESDLRERGWLVSSTFELKQLFLNTFYRDNSNASTGSLSADLTPYSSRGSMNGFKAVASDIVSPSITYLPRNLLTTIKKYAAMTGSKRVSPPTESRHDHKTLSIDVPRSQTRLEIKDMGQGSTSGHGHTATNVRSGHLKNIQRFKPENHASTVIADDTMIACQKQEQ